MDWTSGTKRSAQLRAWKRRHTPQFGSQVYADNFTLPAFSLTASPSGEVPDSGDTILMMLGALVPLAILQRKLARGANCAAKVR